MHWERLFMTAFNLCYCIQWSPQNQESVWRQQRSLLLEETWVSPWARKGSELLFPLSIALSCSSAGKESACNAGDLGSIPGLGRSPGKDYPLQYSGLENSMDCIVYGVAESDTTEWLSLSSISTSGNCNFTQWLKPRTLKSTLTPLSLSPHIQSINKSYWFYLPHISRIQPLASASTEGNLVHDTINSYLKTTPHCLSAFSPTPC